jgi:SAM-dependent methyltransferase
MDEAYGAAYAALYRSHWWWRAREEYLTRHLAAHLSPGSAGEVLDFGCGDGLFFDVLSTYGEPYGIEPDAALLDPQGPWRTRIDTAALRPDPAQRERFGLVVALDVFEHLADPRPVIAELVARTRPGGLWVASVPAFMALWTRHDDLNRHYHRYRRAELGQLLVAHGLELLDARYVFGWTAVAKLALRGLEAMRPGAPAPPRVPSGPINRALLGLCRAEQALFRRIPLPFGSSVIAVARRRGA